MTLGTLMSELWNRPLTVIDPGWDQLNLFRTAIETDTVAASARDTKRRIAGGEIVSMTITTDIDRLAILHLAI